MTEPVDIEEMREQEEELREFYDGGEFMTETGEVVELAIEVDDSDDPDGDRSMETE